MWALVGQNSMRDEFQGSLEAQKQATKFRSREEREYTLAICFIIEFVENVH